MQSSKRRFTYTPLTNEKHGTRLFLTCFIVYLLFVATRNFWPQAMAQLVPGGVFTKDVAGMASSAHMLAYGVGMFLNGFISEKVQPFFYIAASLGISAGANAVAFAISQAQTPNIVPYVVIWAIAGFFQSATWPTMIRTVSTLMPEARRASSGANLFAASVTGEICSYLISQQVLRMASWRALFLTSAAVGFFIFAFWLFMTAPVSKLCCARIEACAEVPEAAKISRTKSAAPHSMLKLLIVSGGFTIIFSIAFKSLAYDGFKGWIATMISELFGLDAGFSVMLSTLVPICNLLGVFIGRLIFNKLTHSEVLSSAIYMTLGSVGLALIAVIGLKSITALLVILFVTIPIIAASSTMYISLVPLRFARFGRSGTAAGLFNSIACAGSGTSSLMIGILSQNFGWQTTVFVLAALMLLGGICSMVTIRRFNKFKEM